jgi:hypothetical protein
MRSAIYAPVFKVQVAGHMTAVKARETYKRKQFIITPAKHESYQSHDGMQ